MKCSPRRAGPNAIVLGILAALLPTGAIHSQPATAPVTILKAGRLIDGTGAEPLAPAVVRIENDKIVQIGSQLDVPPGAQVIDLGSSTLLPGLIDLHNHLMYNSLPLWTEPSRTVPWTSHNQWGSAPTYSLRISQPARFVRRFV